MDDIEKSLWRALDRDDEREMARALDGRADPRMRLAGRAMGGMFLVERAARASPRCLGLLLSRGASAGDASPWGGPSIVAALEGRVDCLEVLARFGADLGVRDGSGQTPLHVAASVGRVDAVRFLIEHGVELDARDHRGWTPMMSLVLARDEEGWRESMEALADAGADLGGALLLACASGDGLGLEWLLAKGADPNEADEQGASALHVAAGADSERCVELLVGAGADVEARLPQGELRSVAALAAARGQPKILERVARAGARLDWPGENCREIALKAGVAESLAALDAIEVEKASAPAPARGFRGL